MRRSYYEITGSRLDVGESKPEIEKLWTLRSRKFLHQLTYAYHWRELDVEKEYVLSNFDEPVILHARLDMYDYKTGNVIDLKTTNAVKWQYERSLIPRLKDIDQVQCYGSMFRDVIKVSYFTLLYADMNRIVGFRVPFLDRTEWIKARLSRLVDAISREKSPGAERSNMCDSCPFNLKCSEDNWG